MLSLLYVQTSGRACLSLIGVDGRVDGKVNLNDSEVKGAEV